MPGKNYIGTGGFGPWIVTGTPGGVGAKRKPPVFMKEGGVIEVAVGGVGTLRNVVRNERG